MMNTRKKGFTLIELVTVVAIVAVLAALAIPAFLDSLRKSRRSDAMNTIMDIQMAQEIYRTNHPDYGTAGATTTTTSSDGHYSVTLTIGSGAENRTKYTIVADALNDQAKDSCGDFTLEFDKGDIDKTAEGVDDLCWRK